MDRRRFKSGMMLSTLSTTEEIHYLYVCVACTIMHVHAVKRTFITDSSLSHAAVYHLLLILMSKIEGKTREYRKH